MAKGRVFPAVPAVFGGGRVLPSPSQFYLTGEDRLRVTVANALVGVAVGIHWRTANPDGDIVPSREFQTPTSDRLPTTADYELGEGSLLNVTAFAAAGAPRIGQTFVSVQLVRGRGPAAIVLGTLLAGYVTATQSLGFPGSPIQSSVDGGGFFRRITGTTPGISGEITEVVPTGARWQLLSVNARLTTSATAISRFPALFLAEGGFDFFAAGQFSAVGASVTSAVWWECGMALESQVGFVGSVAGLLLGNMLLAGMSFATRTGNLQPGDQWTAPSFLVQEWLEVL